MCIGGSAAKSKWSSEIRTPKMCNRNLLLHNLVQQSSYWVQRECNSFHLFIATLAIVNFTLPFLIVNKLICTVNEFRLNTCTQFPSHSPLHYKKPVGKSHIQHHYYYWVHCKKTITIINNWILCLQRVDPWDVGDESSTSCKHKATVQIKQCSPSSNGCVLSDFCSGCTLQWTKLIIS